jgi:hypothetical protein
MSVRVLIVRHSSCFCCGQSSPNSFRRNFGWIHLSAFFVTVFKIDSHYTLVNNCFDIIFKTITIAILPIGAEWFWNFFATEARARIAARLVSRAISSSLNLAAVATA